MPKVQTVAQAITQVQQDKLLVGDSNQLVIESLGLVIDLADPIAEREQQIRDYLLHEAATHVVTPAGPNTIKARQLSGPHDGETPLTGRPSKLHHERIEAKLTAIEADRVRREQAKKPQRDWVRSRRKNAKRRAKQVTL
jgi:hypothetical protein